MEILNHRFSWIRLTVVLIGGIGTFLAFYFGPVWLGRIFLILSITGFSWVVYKHRKLDMSRLRFQITLQQARKQVARMDLNWDQIPPAALLPTYPEHPFQHDLDLTGEYSIHRLVNIAVSRGGSQRLADWLTQQEINPEVVRSRQELVKELKPLFGFRSRLLLNSILVSENPNKRWDGAKLIKWLEDTTDNVSILPILILLAVLACVNIVLFILNALTVLPPFWIISFILYAGIYYFKYKDYKELFGEAFYLARTLNEFKAVLLYLEKYPFKHKTKLEKFCQPFWEGGQKPSKHLRRIGVIASAASLQRNQIVWFFLNVLVPWDLFFGYQLGLFKQRLKILLPAWLDRWYELEALNGLANFAYLNPDGVFPELINKSEDANQPIFRAINIGHPLILDAERVCNDFCLERLGELVLITGSNMAGKSTFLRTLGVNLVLANAGSIVIASNLQTILFRIYTCINVSDSLSDGISYFYAEVKRLKSLLVELEREDTYPLFFLIDEIFRGTNNREREIGSRAYVNALTGHRGIGVISTHDLELVHLEEQISGIYNYHFREDVKDGRMVFDFRLRMGPCPTTNALKIMQMEGLPVKAAK